MNLTPIEREVELNYRHNFFYNLLDGTFYWFGYGFISPSTILPLYVSHFTDSSVVIGLVAFISSFCVFAPQLFTSNWVERAPIKKYFPLRIGLFTERLPALLLAPAAFLFAAHSPILALTSFLLLFAWHSTGAGVIIVAWQDMLAKVIPLDRRGRFFGITNFAGTAGGMLGALIVMELLARNPFPNGYVLAFAIAGVMIFLSWISLAQTREPYVESQKPVVSQWDYLRRSLPVVFGKDANFKQYLFSLAAIGLSSMAGGFVIIYAVRRWNLPDSLAGQYTVAMLVGQALTNLVFGVLADRKGHKLVLELGTLLGIASFILSMVATDPRWFFVVFALRGASLAGIMLSTLMITLEFSSPEVRPSYIGLANTVYGVASGIAPLVGGLLLGWSGYNWLFGLSAGFGVVGFAMLRWRVREPRHETGGDRAAGAAGENP